MKAAAAVLAGSLLFFVGVLTGAGRREPVPPPRAIPLGVSNPAPGTAPATPNRTAKRPSTTTSKPPTATSPPPSAPQGTPSSTVGTATTSTPEPATSSTTAVTGQIEPVDNQVDCAPAGKHARGQRSPCPSTTTATAEGSRGARQR